jgi:hypothetical protein
MSTGTSLLAGHGAERRDIALHRGVEARELPERRIKRADRDGDEIFVGEAALPGERGARLLDQGGAVEDDSERERDLDGDEPETKLAAAHRAERGSDKHGSNRPEVSGGRDAAHAVRRVSAGGEP